MRYAVLVLSLCAAAAAASLDYQESGFTSGTDVRPADWTVGSARPETAPHTYVDKGALVISGNNNVAAHGGWERRIDGVEPGRCVESCGQGRTMLSIRQGSRSTL